MTTEINLGLIYFILFIFTGILTSIIAYINLLYNSSATYKFLVIRYGYIFILYIIIETIILYFQGYNFLIPISILILTFISLLNLPDIFAKIKLPNFFTYLLLLWSYLVFLVLLFIITDEVEIFNKMYSDKAALYVGILSIVLIIIPMALHIFYPERVDD